MGIIYVMQKDGETSHTVSIAKRGRMIDDGWENTITISGWNMSINY